MGCEVESARVLAEVPEVPFAESWACFESLLDYAQSAEVVGMRHGDRERELETGRRELMRVMFQELLDSRSSAKA